jgi:ABC-type uncharacterized transport system permease subunit
MMEWYIEQIFKQLPFGVAIAMVIFALWNPWRAALGALLFLRSAVLASTTELSVV